MSLDVYLNLDGAVRDRLDRGEIVVDTEQVAGSKNPRLVVRGVLDSPPESVWGVIEDVDRYTEFMPRVKVSQVVSREGEVVITRSTIEMPFPLKNLTARIRGVHTIVPGERYQREWSLIEGDYHENTGSWTMVPFDEAAARTLVLYRILVVPRIPIPSRLRNIAQQKTMPDIVERLRKRLRQLGT